MMQVYRIEPDGIKKIRKKLFFRLVPILLFGVAIAYLVSTANAKGKESSTEMMPFFVPFMGFVIVFSIIRGLSKQKALLESYRLTFSDKQISRIQLNTPQVSIDFNDIKEIGTMKDGSLIVKGSNPADLICIPTYIEGYAEIHQRLQQLQPISANSQLPFFVKYRILVSVINTGSMVAVLLINNKWVVAISGCLFLAIMTWSLLRIHENKNIDNRTKRSSWWAIVVMLAVLVTMFIKLSAS